MFSGGLGWRNELGACNFSSQLRAPSLSLSLSLGLVLYAWERQIAGELGRERWSTGNIVDNNGSISTSAGWQGDWGCARQVLACRLLLTPSVCRGEEIAIYCSSTAASVAVAPIKRATMHSVSKVSDSTSGSGIAVRLLAPTWLILCG